jgi:hypothetical protein
LILSRPARAQASSETAARHPAGAERADHFVAHLDGDASAEQQRMRQFE